MTEGFPGRGDDIGHGRTIQQARRGQREFAVALIDGVHHAIAGGAARRTFAEQITLSHGGPRIERGDLHLMHALAAPMFLQHAAAQREQGRGVVGGKGVAVMAAQPARVGTQTDEKVWAQSA